jgi:Arc/MetJ-type ribon-helix-helix transcriptional regulator
MRYIIDLDKKKSDMIRDMINSGKYENVSEFVSAAVENQLYIEQTDAHILSEFELVQIPSAGKEKTSSRSALLSNDIDLSLPDFDAKTVEMPEFEDIALFPGGNRRDCWLWGQINRILPIKLALRVLQVRLKHNSWTDLEGYRNEAALIAGSYKKMIDASADFKNINARSIGAGLPKYVTGSKDKLEAEKSMERYKNQFLAYRRVGDEKLDGALSQLRFVNVRAESRKNDTYAIGLTQAGLEFSKIINPIIDKGNLSSTLSDEEKEFYINHIKDNYPGEYRATIWILGKLYSGITDRNALNNELEKDYNGTWNLNMKVINTQRSGLIARMTELGLIDKLKRGIKVKYLISDLGKEVLSNK